MHPRPVTGGQEGAEPFAHRRRPWTASGSLERTLTNPPAYLGVERSDGHPGNWRGPPRPGPAGTGAGLSITAAREVAASREGVGGGRSSDDGRDNTTRPERRTPASSTHHGTREVSW